MATKNRTVAKPDSDKFIAILAAAKKPFSERGYENTSVRQIVKEANTSMVIYIFILPTSDAY